MLAEFILYLPAATEFGVRDFGVHMKYLLLLLFFTCLIGNAQANDYLRVKSYPAYPIPEEGVGRFVELTIKPKTKLDLQFNAIFSNVTKLSMISNHNLAIPDEAGIHLDISLNGKSLSTHYSKSKAVNNSELKTYWVEIFQLIQDITNEQYHP